MDDVIARIDGVDVAVHGVPGVVMRPNPAERSPGADVIPAEIARQDDHSIASFENAGTSTGNRSDGTEERANVVRVVVQRRGRLHRTVASDVVQKIADDPDEDSGVPQVPVAAHLFGAGTIRLLDEAGDALDAGLELAAGLDVAEARVGARWRRLRR